MENNWEAEDKEDDEFGREQEETVVVSNSNPQTLLPYLIPLKAFVQIYVGGESLSSTAHQRRGAWRPRAPPRECGRRERLPPDIYLDEGF